MELSSDRAFLYGDGIFTTMKVTAGQIELWPLHRQRLEQSAIRLGFKPLDMQHIETILRSAIRSNDHVLKLQVTRGTGGRGYSPAMVQGPAYYVSTADLPNYQALQTGIHVQIANGYLSRQPLLAGIKHCSRLETVMLKHEAEQRGAQDLLICDSAGVMVEATAANVFFYRDGQWFTPSVHVAGVDGVMRQLLKQKLNAIDVSWGLEQLSTVQAIGFCSSLLGIVPVMTVAEQTFDANPIRHVQQQLSDWIKEYRI